MQQWTVWNRYINRNTIYANIYINNWRLEKVKIVSSEYSEGEHHTKIVSGWYIHW